MSVSDRVIAINKRNRHDELCISIKKELPAFMRVGVSLFELNALEVYKETHKSFAAFVADEFGIEKSHAYRLIEAAKVESNLSPIGDTFLKPTSESQYREIAKAPPEKQVEVVKAVAEICQQEERKPTANDYKKAVEEFVAPKVASVEVELVYEDMDDDDEEIALPVKAKPIAIENGKLIRSIIDLVNEARRELDAIEKGPGLEEVCSARRSIDRELMSVKASLTNCIPHSICPRCNGKRCAQCGNLGWCNAQLIKELAS